MRRGRLLLVALALVATAACSRSEARPSGVTERWLQAVSEQGRDGDWRVVDVVDRIEDEKVPSEGGDRPARANATHWLIALALSVALTGGSIFLIDRQPTSTNSAGRS